VQSDDAEGGKSRQHAVGGFGSWELGAGSWSWELELGAGWCEADEGVFYERPSGKNRSRTPIHVLCKDADSASTRPTLARVSMRSCKRPKRQTPNAKRQTPNAKDAKRQKPKRQPNAKRKRQKPKKPKPNAKPQKQKAQKPSQSQKAKSQKAVPREAMVARRLGQTDIGLRGLSHDQVFFQIDNTRCAGFAIKRFEYDGDANQSYRE